MLFPKCALRHFAARAYSKLASSGVPARSASDIASGVDEARALAGRDGMVCSVGSLYMSGAVRARLLGEGA